MTVVKKSFVKGFTAKVLDKDRTGCLRSTSARASVVGHPRAWRRQIGGRMLIPLHGRVGRKRFKAQIAELMRGGNAYFIKNAKGNIVLMAENIKEHDRPLSGFKRHTARPRASSGSSAARMCPSPCWCRACSSKAPERRTHGRWSHSASAAIEKQLRLVD